MKMLDLGCGIGGMSEGFAREGFEVTGIDIVDAPLQLGYPFKFIKADIKTLNGADFRGFDHIHVSMPCRDFSKMAYVGFGSRRPNGVMFAWKDPPNPERGLIAVKAALKFIEDAQPTYWSMENVPGLIPYLGLKPRQVTNISKNMKRAFWGNYPAFLMPTAREKKIKIDIQGPNRSWQRAKIPLSCSRSFAKAVREALESQYLLASKVELP
jgi:site-specific DNA-cytosine methylase